MDKKELTKKKNPDIMERPIYQSNPLIESQKHMSLAEIRLFMLGMQALTPQLTEDFEGYDKDFPVSIIPIEDLERVFAESDGSIKHLKKVLTTAFQRAYIQIHMSHGGYKLRHIFQELEYVPYVGLKLQFDPGLRPYILDLVKKSYTVMTMKHVFPISSDYGIRLIELLLQYKGFAKEIPDDKDHMSIKRRISLKDLKFYLDIPQDKYQGRLDNFKRRVLDNPIEEINKKTIYQLSYQPEKEGRAVTGFTFTMVIPVSMLKPPAITIENNKTPSAEAVKKIPAPADTPVKADATETMDEIKPTEKAKTDSAPLTVATSGMAEADFVEHLTHDMKAEGLVAGRIKHWINTYGVDYANRLFRYGIKEVDRQKREGETRIFFLAKCMDNDWLSQSEQRKAHRAAARQKRQLTKAETLDEELLAYVKTYSINYNPAGEKSEIHAPAIIGVIASDIKNNSLSFTSKRVLVDCNLTVSEFIKKYM